MIVTPNQIFVLELNTIPGLTERSAPAAVGGGRRDPVPRAGLADSWVCSREGETDRVSAATRIAVIGARGRMGSLACEWIRAESDLALAAEIEVGDDVAKGLAAARAEVALDFTTASAARANALAIIGAGVRPVIGTSGLAPGDLEEIAAALTKKKIGGLVVPNFSIGAILAMRFAEQASRYSGIRRGRRSPPHDEGGRAERHRARHRREDRRGARQGAGRRFAGIGGSRPRRSRGGGPRSLDPAPRNRGLPGDLARRRREVLRIQHESTDRSCFRAGVLLALRAAKRADGLVVGLDKLLFEGLPLEGPQR